MSHSKRENCVCAPQVKCVIHVIQHIELLLTQARHRSDWVSFEALNYAIKLWGFIFKTFKTFLSRAESPIREHGNIISQQILPVQFLKVSIPTRDRSRSETELSMFATPVDVCIFLSIFCFFVFNCISFFFICLLFNHSNTLRVSFSNFCFNFF